MTRETIAKISAVGITIILIAILLSQIQIADIIVILAGIDPLYLIVGFVLYICINFFRALRFYILLDREVVLRDLFNIVCVHNMVNNILPARTGELSYIYLLKKLHNKKVGAGIATLFIARIFDLITISLLFFISALMIRDLPEIIMKAVWGIALFLMLIVIFASILLCFGKSFLDCVRRFFGRYNLDRYLVDYLLRKGEEVVESFEKIKANGKVTVVALITVSFGIWLSLYLLSYILAEAMNIDLGYFAVVLAFTFVVFTMILPIQGIGGFGTMESGWAVGFIAMGLTKEVAISSGFGYHIIIWVYFLVLGCYGFLAVKSEDPTKRLSRNP
jgi:uncharacterized protein (TIRG00374 family)